MNHLTAARKPSVRKYVFKRPDVVTPDKPGSDKAKCNKYFGKETCRKLDELLKPTPVPKNLLRPAPSTGGDDPWAPFRNIVL